MHGIICTMKKPSCETLELYHKLTAEDKNLTGALV